MPPPLTRSQHLHLRRSTPRSPSNSSTLSDPPSSPSSASDSVAAAPDPAVPEATEPAVVPVRVRTEDVAPPTKRRKTSPVSTPQPDASRANSVVPRSFPAPAPAKAKAPRQSNSLAGTARTLAAAAAVREREREAASARVTPTHVVEDDAPLPKVPRVGMGEGPFPVPSESDLRHEALYIIEAAKRHREQLALRERNRPTPATNGQNGHQSRLPPSGTARHRLTPPLTGEQYRSTQPYAADYDQPYHTPAYTARPRPASPADNVDGDPFMSSGPSSLRGDQRNRGQPSRPPVESRRYSVPDEDGEEEFESRFASIQDSYASAAATSDAGRRTSLIRPDDPRPPKFYEGQEPTVLLAPNANDIASLNKRGKNDRHEKAYIEGFEGISEEHEENIRRFVDNVRLNLVSLADHYFPVPGPRRDALLEATGRELQKFGLFLTDDAEGALQLR
ncbi:hypothetical protein EHS25_005050 [Saitozyma podzolica]|uniref:Uncharacterized protein n=1 Tax=Saitozyma podzolica TaxID=1890683 RepID=A0A427Y2J1_9TREE|nr:hypothetical protein EHS25_005050 [Saitozyma podzolica]